MRVVRFALFRFNALVLLLGCISPELAEGDNDPPTGFSSLFNSRDFTGWKVPVGDNGHWKVMDGVIDYDALSEAPEDKNIGEWNTLEITMVGDRLTVDLNGVRVLDQAQLPGVTPR